MNTKMDNLNDTSSAQDVEITEELLTVEIPTDIQAGRAFASLPPCAYSRALTANVAVSLPAAGI